MELIHWDESVMTGISFIDAQNQMLVRKVNMLHTHIHDNDYREYLNEILGELLEFSEYHFEMEESYLKKLDIPSKESHLEEHNNFREYIKTHLSEKNRDDLLVATNILVYLNTWINHHIKEIDKNIK